MPRIYKRIARKDYPNQGIKKGDQYFSWHPKGSPWQRSLNQPTRKQLERSEFHLFVMEKQEELEALCDCEDHESLRSQVEEIIQSMRDKAVEEDEKFDKLPENFQQASLGELLEERRDALNEWADEIEGVEIDDDEELDIIVEDITSCAISI